MSQHRICLNMIVRDEARTMPQLLDSVRDFVDFYAIVDTGSTDGTPEVIRQHTRGWLEGEIIERPWVDYSTNRNQALELARSQGSQWAFIIDADDDLQGNKLPALEEGTSYYLLKRGLGFEWTLPSIVWLASDWRWEAPVHEVLHSTDAKRAYLKDPWIRYNARQGFRARQDDKLARDAAMLEKAVRDDPGNTRCWFYLGETYINAQILDKALWAFGQRAQMAAGYSEERCISHFLSGRIKLAASYPFDEILEHYLAAHELSPQRAEPLHGLAELYRKAQNHEAAYVFARMAVAKKPDPKFLFSELVIYDFHALEELLLASYHTNRPAVCRQACDLLRQRLDKIPEPHRTRIEQYLRLGEAAPATWQISG